MGRWLQKSLPKSCVVYPVGAFFERPRANTVRPYRSNILWVVIYGEPRGRPLQGSRLHTKTRYFVLFLLVAQAQEKKNQKEKRR